MSWLIDRVPLCIFYTLSKTKDGKGVHSDIYRYACACRKFSESILSVDLLIGITKCRPTLSSEISMRHLLYLREKLGGGGGRGGI